MLRMRKRIAMMNNVIVHYFLWCCPWWQRILFDVLELYLEIIDHELGDVCNVCAHHNHNEAVHANEATLLKERYDVVDNVLDWVKEQRVDVVDHGCERQYHAMFFHDHDRLRAAFRVDEHAVDALDGLILEVFFKILCDIFLRCCYVGCRDRCDLE